jgi:putative ABC transport system permease protein
VTVLDHVFGPHPPEVNQERTLVFQMVELTGPGGRSFSPPGYRLIDLYARGLPGVERMAVFTLQSSVDSWVQGQRVTSWLKRTDADFWRVLQFEFVEGGPYLEDDVKHARLVAVINEATRTRLLGAGPAVGRTLEADGQRFQVVGVVRDVPGVRMLPFADVWVPLTTAKTDDWRTQLRGSCMALLLADSKDAFPGIQQELQARLHRADLREMPRYDKVYGKRRVPCSGTQPGSSSEAAARTRDGRSASWRSSSSWP